MMLREALEEIRRANGGTLTPERVVDALRPADHPLHDRLEWDDELAGEAYRIDQAARLIRSVRIRRLPADDGPMQLLPAYVSVARPEGRAYEATEEVVRDPIAAQLVMLEMQRDWRALRARYAAFADFWSMVRADVEAREAG